MIGERLKKIRLACGLTQTDIAQALDIDRTTYTYYETGKHEPSLSRAQDLAKLFNTDLATLIGENDIPSGNLMIADESVDYNADLGNFNELKKDEAMLLLYYRRLDKSKQAKLLKTIKEKYSK